MPVFPLRLAGRHDKSIRLTMSEPKQTKSHPFPATRWTLVEAVQGGEPAAAENALGQLCESYWYPIYAFLRRDGLNRHDAEDLTQAFFQRLIAEDSLRDARKENERLRSWLLGVLKRLISDHVRHGSALKRGGSKTHISFDEMKAEERYACEPADGADPERLYFKVWARDLLATVLQSLRLAAEAGGSAAHFDLLLPFLTLDQEPPSHRELANQIGSSEAATRILIHRLRVKYRSLLLEEVTRTVLAPEDVPEEMAWLRSVLSAP